MFTRWVRRGIVACGVVIPGVLASIILSSQPDAVMRPSRTLSRTMASVSEKPASPMRAPDDVLDAHTLRSEQGSPASRTPSVEAVETTAAPTVAAPAFRHALSPEERAALVARVRFDLHGADRKLRRKAFLAAGNSRLFEF